MASSAVIAAPRPGLAVRILPNGQRLILLAGIGGITAGAWVYLAWYSHHMGQMGQPSMVHMGTMLHAASRLQAWSIGEFGVRFFMWAVMMIAMMVPTALPMTFVYTAVARKAAAQENPVPPTFVFVAGYVSLWILFSVVATLVQRGLDQAALLTPTMVSHSVWLGGSLMIAAGIYQFSPLKNACLTQCRNPAQFLSSNWRTGTVGAFRIGLKLGLYCLGCCSILMGLLFVGGMMNLLWIATVFSFILIEKTLRFGDASRSLAGIAMILFGAVSLAV
jgi:predicted metal-binding membrane protein